MRATGIAARGRGGFGLWVGQPVFVGSWEQMARLIRFGVFLIAAVERLPSLSQRRSRANAPSASQDGHWFLWLVGPDLGKGCYTACSFGCGLS